MAGRRLVVSDGEREWRVTAEDVRVAIDGGEAFAIRWTGGEALVLAERTHDGRARDRVWVAVDRERRWAFHDGIAYELTVEAEDAARAPVRHHQGALTAPMPATVIAVNVEPGASVVAGDILLVLEAMKMELPVRAPASGTVAAVHCRAGDLVRPGVSLVDLS